MQTVAMPCATPCQHQSIVFQNKTFVINRRWPLDTFPQQSWRKQTPLKATLQSDAERLSFSNLKRRLETLDFKGQDERNDILPSNSNNLYLKLHFVDQLEQF